MKRFVSLFLFILLVPFPCFASDAPVDFGYNVTEVYAAYACLFDEIDIDLYSGYMNFSSADCTATFNVDDYQISTCIDPQSRLSNSVSVCFFRYGDLEKCANNLGFLFGRSIVYFAGGGDDVLLELGMYNPDIWDSMDDYTDTYSSNGYTYSIKIDETAIYSIVFTISCDNVSSVPCPSISLSNDILDCMQTHNGVNVSARFLYDSSTDQNGILGDDGYYTSKINFAIDEISPNAESIVDLSVSSGGSIEVFRYENDAIERMNKIDNYSFFDTSSENYMFRYNNFLLRLSIDLPSSLISLYVNAFVSSVEAINP
ncbi:MAG: hypothetical protein EOM54_13485 [Clostridia bacterium]|nr:hypothetical protein [Clostridia bacterium]